MWLEWCSDIQVNLGTTDIFTVFSLPRCEHGVRPVPVTLPLECPVFTRDIASAPKMFRVSTGLWAEQPTPPPLKNF